MIYSEFSYIILIYNDYKYERSRTRGTGAGRGEGGRDRGARNFEGATAVAFVSRVSVIVK